MDKRAISQALAALTPAHPTERAYFLQHRHRYAATLAHLPDQAILGKIVADAGVVPGHLAQAAKLLGALKVIGIDYDPERFDFRRRLQARGIEIVACDLDRQNLPFAIETIDTVVLTEVIEHLENPDRVLAEIMRVLKPGGFLVLTTPNIANLANRVRRLFGRSVYPQVSDLGSRQQQRHRHEYTMKELRQLLGRHGYNLVKSAHIAGTERALLAGVMPSPLPRVIGMAYALVPLAAPPLRSYLFVLAQKPLTVARPEPMIAPLPEIAA